MDDQQSGGLCGRRWRTLCRLGRHVACERVQRYGESHDGEDDKEDHSYYDDVCYFDSILHWLCSLPVTTLS